MSKLSARDSLPPRELDWPSEAGTDPSCVPIRAAQEANVRPTRRSDLIVHELDGEALVYDAQRADTHRLNETAYLIWRQCDGQRDVEQLAAELVERYEVTFEAACDHVTRILSEFGLRHLLMGDIRERNS